MAELDAGVSRAALLEMRRDRQVFEQGHRFLDEKRMLLAQEILRRLQAHEILAVRFGALQQQAFGALQAAVGLHGVDGLAVYPPLAMYIQADPTAETSFLGVPLLDADPLELTPDAKGRSAPALPSFAAEACAEAFRELIAAAGELAVSVTNLQRLAADYTRTERRTLALEDILLPEMRAAERDIDSRLEEAERDELVRVRWFAPSA